MTIRIGEVARRAGIVTSAIRYYEREGLILKADRRGNTRVYGVDIFDRLALIELAKSAGFTVAETRHLVRGISRRTPPGPRWRTMAQKKAGRGRRAHRRGETHAHRATGHDGLPMSHVQGLHERGLCLATRQRRTATRLHSVSTTAKGQDPMSTAYAAEAAQALANSNTKHGARASSA